MQMIDYINKLEDNLFEPLSQSVLKNLTSGDGNEFGSGITPGEMQALHLSSAISVNFFDYWTTQEELSDLAKGLKVPSTKVTNISFEKSIIFLKNLNAIRLI